MPSAEHEVPASPETADSNFPDYYVAISWQRVVVAAIAAMVLLGFALRLNQLGRVGFAEDEINKLEAVRAYEQGDFSSNAEHPALMKALMLASMSGARAWHSLTGQTVSDEAALRFPNALFGALTAIPLFLLTALLFDRRTGLWAAAFWSFGVNAITYNRIGKEDTLMVFFLLFAFYFFMRAKQVDGRDRRRVIRNRYLSSISFGLMMASKYFPHYLGLNMLFHHFYRMRKPFPGEPRYITPLSFFLMIGVVFLLANPVLILPSVWAHLNAYSGEKLLTHNGYMMGSVIYVNRMSASPFWGLPVYFYLLFLAIKVPIVTMIAALVGFVPIVRRWRHTGYGFVLFMLLFWLVPYSLVGAKWLRYTLSLMPFVYMSAAIGAMVVLKWTAAGLEKLKSGRVATAAATTALGLLFVALPAWTSYASAPHYGLYANALGRGYAGYFFHHDEFYDDGLNEAIRFVSEHAPRQAQIVSEAPGVVRYYSGKFGRTDLQSQVLSDPKFVISDSQPAYFILQKGRTYFENVDKMKDVKTRFTLVYARCLKGHTAAEVYVSQPGADPAVSPCGDVRP